MYPASKTITNTINSPVRKIIAKVELYNGSTLINTFSYNDALQSIDITKLGEEGKFFGFGVGQKVNIKLRDKERALDISTANTFKIYFGANGDYINTHPTFRVTEVHRDENTNALSITAYDALERAAAHTVAELSLASSYTIGDFAAAVASFLGLGLEVVGVGANETCFDTSYMEGANFEGTENLRDALNAIAEATQTIYYINAENNLVFKRLDVSGEPVLTLGKSDYFTLESRTNRRLTHVCHATELGDNVEGGLRTSATGEAVRLDKVIPEEHEIKVEVASKNLIYYPYYNVSGAISGVTYTVNADGSITANGTATTDSFFYLVQSYKIPAGTYTLSSINVSTNRELRAAIYNTDNSLDRYIYNETFTIDGEKLIYVYLVITTGNTVSNITYKPILELGSTATDYTPYVSDFSGVTITKSGSNLIAYPYAETSKIYNEITFVDNADGTITASGTTTSGAFFQFKNNSSQFFLPRGKYHFRAVYGNGSLTTFYAYVALLKDTGNVNYFDTGEGVAFELEETTQLSINCVVEKSHDGSEVIFKPQLEVGAAASDFEAGLQVATYTPEADGTVTGITSISPTTTLYTSNAGVLVNAECYIENSISGTTQYVRNNPFWDLREDIADLVDNALAAVYKLTINQFDCSWRGNHLLEIGDKIALVTKDDDTVISYVLNDTLEYNGALSQNTQWNYGDGEGETASNPSTLGEVLNQTSAKVDKVNKEIELLAGQTGENSDAIASIRLDTQSITSTVQRIETETQEGLENLNAVTNDLSTQIQQSAEDFQISINEIKENGVNKVVTTTGFVFNEEGLTVSKSGSEMTTQITEDGMTVYKNNEAVLTANNEGVDAVNLRATTYLIIGTNSRFEDYGSDRTGCFWIGN